MKVYRNLRLAPKEIQLKTSRATKRTSSVHDPKGWLGMQAPWQSVLEAHGDERAFSARALGIVGVSVLAISTIFLWQLFRLQLVDGSRLVQMAEGNRIRSRVIYAQRGTIYDRNGHTLATNTASFQLVVTPYSLPKDAGARNQLYVDVAAISDSTIDELRATVEEKGLEHVLPIVVDERISHTQMLKLKSYLRSQSAFRIDEIPIRSYDSSASLAQVVGYTARIDNHDLEKNPELYPVDFIGKAGVEASYDEYLRGQNGFEQIEVDAHGRPVRTLARREAIPGSDLYLTIDAELQKTLVAEMQTQMKKAKSKKASAVAMHPDTGEVLAIVSLPSYDNNLFSYGISDADYAKLTRNKLQPLYNSAIGGSFPSGSTIKPVVAAAALQEKVVKEDTIIVDTDHISVGSFRFHSWQSGGLGPKDVRGAIAWSSNIYFMTVGGGYGKVDGLGVEKLTDYYRQFGFGALSGIDLPGEVSGRVPDPAWKQEFKGEGWYIGDTYNISIGQGDFLISPLQLAVAHSAIANGGSVLQPRVGSKVSSSDGSETIFSETSRLRNVSISERNLQIAREGMRDTIARGSTCSCTFADVGVVVAGKSGTAETDPNSDRKPHAWYSAFAPFDKPEIVVSVLLEEGEKGSGYAAPPIAAMMEKYFANATKTASSD